MPLVLEGPRIAIYDEAVKKIIKELLGRRGPAVTAAILSLTTGLVLGWSSAPRMVAISIAMFAAFGALIVLGGRIQEILMEIHRIHIAQGALWALSGLSATLPKVLPPLAAGGIRAPSALALAQTVALWRPRVVVELGPGASSILILQAAASVPYEIHLTTVEHDHSYYELAARTFDYLALDCDLILAPLERWEGHGYQIEWYAQDGLQGIPKRIDLLVVDGPPGHDDARRRFPAFPVLRQLLAPGALLFVDDTDRQGDRESVEEWCRMDDGLHVVQDGGSFMLLRRGSS